MIAEFESRILALIDNMVDHASDDELFAGGYLRGHLTLAVAELEGEGEHSADAVHSRVSQSPEKAISAGELSPPDQILVQGMWHNLYQQAKKSGLSHVVARVRRQPYPEIACPHGFISPLFPSAVFSPTADSDSAPPWCRYPAAAVPRSFAPPAAQRLTARSKVRATRARQA